MYTLFRCNNQIFLKLFLIGLIVCLTFVWNFVRTGLLSGPRGGVAQSCLQAVSGIQVSNSSQPPSSDTSRRHRLPQCIIIGAKKAGTRALLTFLGYHPDIVIAPSEVHFFDLDENYKKGVDWYRKQMKESRSDQIVMEKSPSYFHTKVVPSRIYALNSSIKVILIVRDPTERAISDYTQAVEKRRKLNLTGAILPMEHYIMRGRGGHIRPRHNFVYISLYYHHFKNWLQWFPRNQILLVSDTNFTSKNPYQELNRVEKFLGLRTFFTRQSFSFTATKGFYCYGSDEDTKCLGESKGRSHAAVKPDTVRRLRAFFAEPNRKFYTLVEQDFNWPLK